MTGEITLRARFPDCGVKERSWLRIAYGLHTVILPKRNEQDLTMSLGNQEIHEVRLCRDGGRGSRLGAESNHKRRVQRKIQRKP
jgi:hypothetical protein